MEALAKTVEVAKTTVESSPGAEIDPDARIEALDAGDRTNRGEEFDPDARIGEGGDSANTETVNIAQDTIQHSEIASVDTRQKIINDLNNMTDRINQRLDGDGDWITDSERESFVKLLHDARPDYPPWIDGDPDPEWTSAYNRAQSAFNRIIEEEGGGKDF